MSFFGVGSLGNPFATPVGQRIEQATDPNLASENWALNMEICDLVNETEDGPKDAIKAIRKRLQQNAAKNYTVVMYTLTVLETCVKNCGRRFHALACSKDFVQELVKLIGPKNDPPTAVQEKVLSLIQAWADAFRHKSELQGVVQVYQDLLAKGIEFPATDLDAMAPIHTPERTVEVFDKPAVHQNVEHTPSNQPLPALAPEQRAKLRSELDVVQGNMAVLSEMLSELVPGKETQSDLELLHELYATCQQMQSRIVELVEKLTNDELTMELLHINDDLNNLFLRYSRWEKNRGAGNIQSPSAVLAKAVPPTKTNDSLIDLNDGDDDLSNRLAKMCSPISASAQLAQVSSTTARNGPQEKDDEFDMFAQSRTTNYEKSKTDGSSYSDNLNPNQNWDSISSATTGRSQALQFDRENDIDEMAAWLKNTPGQTEESVTSTEFDRFLAERAAAAESLPATTGSNNQTRPSTKDDKSSLLA